MNVLQEQIDRASRSIFTDSYSMSIGELMSMYKDELNSACDFVLEVIENFKKSIIDAATNNSHLRNL